MFRLISRVCAEFHDNAGTVLFAIRPADRLRLIDAPDSIRQDPLYDMLLHDGSIEVPYNKDEQKKLENDPEKPLASEMTEAPVQESVQAEAAGETSAEDESAGKKPGRKSGKA